MNKVVLIGRLARDPEMRFTAGSGIAVTNFTLAVDRDYKKADGTKEADFINCIAWRKLAEVIANNLSKGKLIAVSGSIQTRKYQSQDGSTKYATEVIVNEFKFLESSGKTNAQAASQDGEFGEFSPIEEEDDIPF